MAITIDATASATGADQGAGNHAFTGSITIGTLTSGILVVGINCYNSGGTAPVTGVRLDSSTGTLMSMVGTNQAGPSTESQSAIFYLLNPPSGAHTFYVEAGYAMGVIIASSWSGVSQVAPTTLASASFNSGAETLTGTTVNGDMVIDMIGGSSGNGTTATPGAGQTQIATLAQGSTLIGFGSYKAATSASTTMSWTGATTLFTAANAIILAPVVGTGKITTVSNITSL